LGKGEVDGLLLHRDHDALDRSIDVQVLRLRQIVEEDPSKPRFIKTVWGVGYMLIADVES